MKKFVEKIDFKMVFDIQFKERVTMNVNVLFVRFSNKIMILVVVLKVWITNIFGVMVAN